MGQEIGSVFPALGEMYARQAMMRAQTADLQNQQGGQQALGSYFQQIGQGATPAPGQASVPAQIPGGTDHGYSAFRSAQQAVPSQLQGSRFAEVPSPTDVASGDSMNVSPDQGPRVPQATPAGAGATPTGQPQVSQPPAAAAPDGKPFRSLDDILHGLVKANPKATSMQIYQGASAYMPWMNHEDQIRMAQAMQQYRYDALGARNDRATQSIQEKYDALKQQNDQFLQRALANKDKLGALQAIAARKAQLQAQAQEVNATTFGNKNDPTTQALLQKIGAENAELDQQAAALQQGVQPGGAAQGGTPAPTDKSLYSPKGAVPSKFNPKIKSPNVSLLGGPGPRVPQPYGGTVG